MMRWALLLLVLVGVVASAVAAVYSKQLHRQSFVKLTELERERDALNVEFGRLELEQATLSEPSRVERLAREKLGLDYPLTEQVRMVAP